MLDMTSKLLFSVKPIYADQIFNGTKTAELRRRVSTYLNNREVLIYVTSPVRQLRGGFRIEYIWSGPPETVWEEVSDKAGVSRQDFDAYYEGLTTAHALKITDVWEFDEPFGLASLRDMLENFVVPQSWRYLKTNESYLLRRPIGQHGI